MENKREIQLSRLAIAKINSSKNRPAVISEMFKTSAYTSRQKSYIVKLANSR